MIKVVQLMLACSLLVLPGCRTSVPEFDFTVATSANMQFAMEALLAGFAETSGGVGNAVVSSSGKLSAQIQAGAPYDLFVSADLKYPEQLHAASLTTGPPRVYAYGQLVLWTQRPDLEPSLDALTTADVKHIALANPQTAPYGIAAAEVLQHLELLDTLTDKLVYGESIAQTNQFINAGAADIGFTALSVITKMDEGARGKAWLVPQEHHSPIVQAAVVVRSTPERERWSKAFIDFLASPSSRRILAAYGYLLPKTPVDQ